MCLEDAVNDVFNNDLFTVLEMNMCLCPDNLHCDSGPPVKLLVTKEIKPSSRFAFFDYL
jgi:hypothetical protein